MQRLELSAGRFQHVSWVDRTGSTNADVAELAEAEPHVPLVLFADEQTAGRGRLDRSWEMDPGGGLMVSFFVPWLDVGTAHLVPTALGIAISAIVEATGRSVGLKWPNDVVVADGELAGKKLGGMLSASVIVDGELAGVVSGLGCNVSWPPKDLATLPDAAALDHLDGSDLETSTLGGELVAQFDSELTTLDERGAQWLLNRYRDRCVTLGRRVRVEVANEMIVGTATDIDPSGALLLEADGRQRRVDVGDVVHLRGTG